MSISRIFSWRMKPTALAVVLLALVGGWHWLAGGAVARGSGSSGSEQLPEASDSSAGFAVANAALPLGVSSGSPLAPAMSGCATPSFGAATGFDVGSRPVSVAVGDFNRDGSPDLAVADDTSNNVGYCWATARAASARPRASRRGMVLVRTQWRWATSTSTASSTW